VQDEKSARQMAKEQSGEELNTDFMDAADPRELEV
jgi:hypothetical protein